MRVREYLALQQVYSRNTYYQEYNPNSKTLLLWWVNPIMCKPDLVVLETNCYILNELEKLQCSNLNQPLYFLVCLFLWKFMPGTANKCNVSLGAVEKILWNSWGPLQPEMPKLGHWTEQDTNGSRRPITGRRPVLPGFNMGEVWQVPRFLLNILAKSLYMCLEIGSI